MFFFFLKDNNNKVVVVTRQARTPVYLNAPENIQLVISAVGVTGSSVVPQSSLNVAVNPSVNPGPDGIQTWTVSLASNATSAVTFAGNTVLTVGASMR